MVQVALERGALVAAERTSALHARVGDRRARAGPPALLATE